MLKRVRWLFILLLLFNIPGAEAVTLAQTSSPPAAPTNLAAAPGVDEEGRPLITLSWKDNADNELGFKIERSLTENGEFRFIVAVNPNVETFSDTNLAWETAYWYRVKAYNNAGESTSNVVSAVTFPPRPSAPTNLTAQSATGTQINLSWQDTSENEKGFKIERKTSGDAFQQIAIVGANITAFADTGLTSGVTFTYRIRAFNDGGDSAYSNEASATTPGKPSAPTGLKAVAVSGSQINLTWTDTSNNEKGFKIERKTGSGSFSQIAAVEPNTTGYADKGLAAGVTYTYRVRAYNDAGDSAYSNEASATTEAPPAAPEDLFAEVLSKSQIKLSWRDRANNETGFRIERKMEGGSYSQIATVNANITSYTDTGLSAEKTYYYRVRAYNASGNSPYSNEVMITTAVPPVPANLSATTLFLTEIYLTWQDNADNETGFKIERKREDGSFSQIATVGANVTSYNDANLTPHTVYFYRVRAYNAIGNSPYTAEVSAATTFLNPPSNLTAVTVSRSQINLSWQDSSDNESGFKIERRTAGGSFSQIAAVGRNVTSYSDSGLADNTTYYYRVRAYTSTANSAYSNEASATTGAVPAAPSNLTAALVSGTQINLSWKDNANNESGFKIERKTAGGSFVQIAAVGANTTSYADSGLAQNTTYFYRLRAYNAAGDSPYSNEIAISTGSPSAPTKLTATVLAGDRIMLTWVDNASNESGFKIERRTAGGSFSQIAAVGADTTVYADTGLTPGTAFFYRVRAYNAAGNSAYTNEAGATTIAEAEKIITFNVGKTAYYVNAARGEMDAAPIIVESRAFLPIRYLAEAIGAKLEWDQREQKATVSLKGRVIELWIGKNTARVDGQARLIDVQNLKVTPLVIPPGRTMLPLRFVGENLGCRVEWNQGTQEIKITYPAIGP